MEGYELEVLKGLNVEKHRPRYILVETNRLNEVLDVLDQRYGVTDKLSVHDYLLPDLESVASTQVQDVAKLYF